MHAGDAGDRALTGGGSGNGECAGDGDGGRERAAAVGGGICRHEDAALAAVLLVWWELVEDVGGSEGGEGEWSEEGGLHFADDDSKLMN